MPDLTEEEKLKNTQLLPGNSGGSNGSNNGSNNDNHVSSVSIKLPPFWPKCPTTWFIQVETQFSINKIKKDRSMYEHVIISLPQDIIMTVVDIIENPPATDLYVTLKKTLIERHSMSDEKRLEKLLSDKEMGYQKPSDFYRSLESLAGTSGVINREFLVKLWMRRLPKQINIALVATGKTSHTELTSLADRIWEASKHDQIGSVCPQENNAGAPRPVSNFESQTNTPSMPGFSQMCSALAEMTTRFRDMEQELSEVRSMMLNRQPPRNRSTSRNRNRFRSRSRSSNNSRDRDPNLCWYHNRWGDRANNCQPGCKNHSTFVKPSNPSKNY